MGIRVQRGANAPTQMDRIEAKLDALAEMLTAMALDPEGEDELTDFGGERDQSQPL